MAVSKTTKAEVKKEVTVKTVKPAADKVVKTTGLTVAMFDAKGAKSGTATLPKEVFGAKINKPLMAQAVRVYLANQRLGTASTQTRGEVTGSTKKIYRQKGTGNARHGGKRAPIFVKGGVAHGPHPHDFSLSMPKKMRKASLISALSLKAKEGDIKVISGLSAITPKTKEMSLMIQKITEDKKGKSKVLLVTSAAPKDLGNVYKAGRNIENVRLMNASLLNTYEVLKYKNLYFMKESLEVLAGGNK